MLEKAHSDGVTKVNGSTDEELNAQIAIPSGPGKMGQARVMEALWIPLLDMIHHRGQFSV